MEMEQKPTKKRTNQEKIAVCEKYEDYLKIIHEFGNKVMLLKQLQEFAIELGYAKTYSSFMYQIQALFDNEIIKTEPFFVAGRKTQHHIVILKKFALRYLKGETASGGGRKVAPVPKLKSNDRILLSTFKSSFILQKLIPSLRKHKDKVELIDVFNELEKGYSSILYEKNQGVKYAQKFFDGFSSHIDEYQFGVQLGHMQDTADKREKGLLKGSYSSIGKGIATRSKSGVEEGKSLKESVKSYNNSMSVDEDPKVVKQRTGELQVFESNKTKKIFQYSFEHMLRANMYVVKAKETFNEKGVATGLDLTVLLFDYKNSQDVYSFGTQIACTFLMFNQLLKETSKLTMKVGIIGFDETACESIRESAKEVVRNPHNQNEGQRLSLTLKNWQIKRGMKEGLTISYAHYDITNSYMDGKKLANLLRGRSSKQDEKR